MLYSTFIYCKCEHLNCIIKYCEDKSFMFDQLIQANMQDSQYFINLFTHFIFISIVLCEFTVFAIFVACSNLYFRTNA